jgi:excisionase family DNA binding protein
MDNLPIRCAACAALEARVAELEKRLGMAPTAAIDADALYTAQEAAERLRCGKTNVYDLMESGELAVTRTGAGRKGLRIRGSDLLAFLDARKEGGPRPRMAFKRLGGRSAAG